MKRAFAQGQPIELEAALREAELGREYPVSPLTRIETGGNVSAPDYVKFRDLSSPASIYAVEPADIGGGAAIRRIVMQTTKEPVTRTIHKWLPWLPEYKGLRLTGKRSIMAARREEGLAARMGTGSFRIP